MTYSIVARDPGTGQLGVAVQSHWFSVGSVVTWAEAGTGVVATQAFGEPSYGQLGLTLMRGGKTSTQAIVALTTVDDQATRRQVAMIDRHGNVAAHTGEGCLAEASHVIGETYSCQANMMLNATVPGAMAAAFEAAQGELVDRLLAALEAAEAEGGDIRGRQSAAMLIVKGEGTGNTYDDRVLELRIEDHAEPLVELRRLVGVKRSYELMNDGDAHLAKGALEEAAACYEAAQRGAPDNAEFTFWRGVMLANFGRFDEASGFLDRAFSAGHGDWKELLRRLPPGGLLSQDAADRLLGAV
jgi:uncharacterized Ntn-hydrolase superfamily protein